MNIVFTLCSINYLAQAKVLYESVKCTNPSWRFIIGLVDKNSTVDLSFLDCEVLSVEEIEIAGFEKMVKEYQIVELLTSVKPFYINWLYQQNPDAKNVIYLDPDIKVFGSLKHLENLLTKFDVVLTPQHTSPINDGYMPTELHVSRTGLYNLGFIGTRRSENTISIMTWWENRLRDQCILDLTRGYFVDQLWMNLAPIFFENVLVEKNPGYNMAHWNLHERVLSNKDGEYFVNDQYPLIFYHFSHFNPANPQKIATFHTRFSFATRQDISSLFKMYTDELIKADYFALKKITCFYMKDEKAKKRRRNLENFLRQALSKSLKSKLKKILS